MTMPDERTLTMIRTWEFLRHLKTAKETPTSLRSDAETLLRHFPLPYEIGIMAQLRPDLFVRPALFSSDLARPNTVGTLLDLLSRFEPNLRVVVEAPNGELIDLRQIVLMPRGFSATTATQKDSSPLAALETSTEQVVLIAGKRPNPAYASDELDSVQSRDLE